jgi:hypothetical protein
MANLAPAIRILAAPAQLVASSGRLCRSSTSVVVAIALPHCWALGIASSTSRRGPRHVPFASSPRLHQLSVVPDELRQLFRADHSHVGDRRGRGTIESLGKRGQTAGAKVKSDHRPYKPIGVALNGGRLTRWNL